VFDIANNSHDRMERIIFDVAAKFDLFPKRIFVGEEPVGEHLIDDHDSC